MTVKEIIDGLKFTVDMFLFDPITGETYTEPRNDMDKNTIDACKGAIELLEQRPCEDAISRQVVINKIFNASDNNCDVVLSSELMDRIKALPPVTPQTRWIPVSERLPEANRAVLTYIDTGATKTYCLACWNDVRKRWEEWTGYELIEKDKGYKVLAWQPLPEPYKEES